MTHGSIYFGGNGPGFALVAAFSRSHEKGDPVFTLNQSTLANGKYLAYLRATYSRHIATPRIRIPRMLSLPTHSLLPTPKPFSATFDLLIAVGRVDEAILLAQIAAEVDPSNGQLKNLLVELDRIKERQK
jgi:hypothetical protein